MGRLSLWEKYQMLFGKVSSPKACDCTRATIYTFEKYCKHCRAGMMKPEHHTPRPQKKFYKIGFCSSGCQEKGPRPEKIFVPGTKPPIRSRPKNMTIDDMVAVSMALERQEAKMPPFVKVLREVDTKYNLLSEKLSVMEIVTGERWYASKFYYWMERAFA